MPGWLKLKFPCALSRVRSSPLPKHPEEPSQDSSKAADPCPAAAPPAAAVPPTAPPPHASVDEEARLAAVARLRAVQPGDRLTPMMSVLRCFFEVPLAYVALVDRTEVVRNAINPGRWQPYPRGEAVCAWTLATPQPQLLLIEDLQADPRFLGTTHAAGPAGCRFYCGAPLVGANGLRYGTCCIADSRPRSFRPDQLACLVQVAGLVASALESGTLGGSRAEQGAAAEERLQEALPQLIQGSPEPVLACALDAGGWRVLQANAAAVLAAGLAPGDLEAGGLPFWQLFDPPPPAPRSNCFVDLDALQQQAERRQAFWLACKLLPPDQRAADGFANGGPPAPTLRRRSADLRRCSSDSASSGGGGGGAGPSSFDSQGSAKPSRDPEQLWDVCFEPCAVPPPAPGPQLLFTATLHPANIGATMAAARLGLLDARQEPAAPLGGGELSGGLELLPSQLLRPQSMEGVVLGGLLGRGASGKAYLGTWHGSSVAVKIIGLCGRPTTAGGEMARYLGLGGSAGAGAGGQSAGGGNQAVMEAVLSKTLSHPHIVRTHAYGVEAVTPRLKQVWIVQDLCTGGSLIQAVLAGRFKRPSSGNTDLRAVLLTAQEIAAALAYLHACGVVHGDLSGNNVLLQHSAKDRRQFVAMVNDFGVSQLLGPAGYLSAAGYGTISHMPPELVMECKLSPAVDVYSFGVLLWEMVAGQRAYSGMSCIQILGALTRGRSLEVPESWHPAVKGLIARCIDPDWQQRPDATTVLAEVERMLQGFKSRPAESPAATPQSPSPMQQPHVRPTVAAPPGGDGAEGGAS